MKQIKNLTFYKKLLLSYFAVMLLFLISIFLLFYNITFKSLLGLYQNNLSAIMSQKAAVIDSEFTKIVQTARNMITDRAFFQALETIDSSPSSLITTDRVISDIFSQYMAGYNPELQIVLATDSFVFGQQSSQVPISNYNGSKILKFIKEQDINSCWFPSYQIPAAFHLKDDYDRLPPEFYFTYAQRLNLSAASIYYNGYSQNYGNYLRNPTLLFMINSDYFKNRLAGSIPTENTFYFLLDQTGRFIYHTDFEWIGRANRYDINLNSSKIQTFQKNGNPYLLCYTRLETTGWTICSAIPYRQIGLEILSNIWHKLFFILFIFILCFSLFAFILSRFLTRPVYLLKHAMQATGNGNFNTYIHYSPKDEFGSIIDNFNEMNFKIKKLIKTNYETTLRRQEAELSALHFQLNPHFLYNTLNILNLMILSGEKQMCSSMIVRLSQMLKYTTDTDASKVILKKDMEWLDNYFYMTRIRFGNRIKTKMSIQPVLYECLVPKLFLQPFIENAVIHGFKNQTQNCILEITGFLFHEKCIFEIRDNGCGISPEILAQIEQIPEKSIGISNVRHRLELLYSKQASIQICSDLNSGTRVLISFPFETEN